jgi:small subunit ribosomal protein S5
MEENLEAFGEEIITAEETKEHKRVMSEWAPKTEAGRKVLAGEIGSLDELFESGYRITEPEIVDYLVPNLKTYVLESTKTTKVVMAGRKFAFRATVAVGDGNKYIGLGSGKAADRFSSIRKAERNARKNIIKVNKSCGSWECNCGEGHSIPFKVEGKGGSVRVMLLPGPRGTGLVISDSMKPLFEFVGIKDVWSKTSGRTKTIHNFAKAVIDALKKTSKMKMSVDIEKKIQG